jgi:hypothetical protein
MSIAKFFLDAFSATAQTAVRVRGQQGQPARPGHRPVACTPCAASALRAQANQKYLPRGYSPPRRSR